MLYPPFDMLVNGEYQGFCRDLADAVAAELGVTPDYHDLPWTSVLPGKANLEVRAASPEPPAFILGGVRCFHYKPSSTRCQSLSTRPV